MRAVIDQSRSGLCPYSPQIIAPARYTCCKNYNSHPHCACCRPQQPSSLHIRRQRCMYPRFTFALHFAIRNTSPDCIFRNPHHLCSYPGYDTSFGWLQFSDEKLEANARAAVAKGFQAVKLKASESAGRHTMRLLSFHLPLCNAGVLKTKPKPGTITDLATQGACSFLQSPDNIHCKKRQSIASLSLFFRLPPFNPEFFPCPFLPTKYQKAKPTCSLFSAPRCQRALMSHSPCKRSNRTAYELSLSLIAFIVS